MLDRKENWRLAPGEKFGDYEVVRLLGKGGMGAVYLMRAQDGMQYAVKVMSIGEGDNGLEFRKRFLREAEFAIKIKHHNLIPVHSVGEDSESGLGYLVMDYMPGGSLADRLSKCKRLSVEEAVSIAGQVAAALEVAHRHGVIHRDIKPENILFDLDGTPKLADMGAAKFSGGAGGTTVTTTGMIVGTPAYMAPEQMMDSHHVDVRADIYSLGVVLYEMLTGSRPCAESTTIELLTKAIKGDPLPDVRTLRPEISASLAYVLSLMCAPNPGKRPSSSWAVVELFMKADNGTLEVPKEMLTPVVVKRKNWRKPLIASVAAFAASVAVVAVGWLTMKTIRAFADKQEGQAVCVTNFVTQVVVVTNGTTPVATSIAVDGCLDRKVPPRLQEQRGIRKGYPVGLARVRANPAHKTGEEWKSSLAFDMDAAPEGGQSAHESDLARSGNSSKHSHLSDCDSSGSSTSSVSDVGVVGIPVDKTPTSLKTIAVFVQNRTRVAGVDDNADGVRDRLAASIAATGAITVMDSAEVDNSFRRSDVTTEEEKRGLVNGLLSGGSAPRVAQILGCDYLVVGVIKGAKVINRMWGDSRSKVFALQMILNVMDSSGENVFLMPWSRQLPVDDADGDPLTSYDMLFDQWADDAGRAVANSVARLRKPVVAQGLVTFTVSTTIDRVVAALESQTKDVGSEQLQELHKAVGCAKVELDGVMLGFAPGNFAAKPGIHQIKVYRAWMRPFSRNINVHAGDVFETVLEMSEEGLAKWGSVEALRESVAQGYAEAAMKNGIKVNVDSCNWRDVTYGGRTPIVVKQTN